MIADIAFDLPKDPIVSSVAHALYVANAAARVHGVEPNESLITISEEWVTGQHAWKIQYGARDYVHRRGGDLILELNEGADCVSRVRHGQ